MLVYLIPQVVDLLFVVPEGKATKLLVAFGSSGRVAIFDPAYFTKPTTYGSKTYGCELDGTAATCRCFLAECLCAINIIVILIK